MVTAAKREPAKVTLTKAAVAKLRPPASGRRYYYDTRTPGLTVCVTATGAKTFYLYRKVNRRPVRHRLGTIEQLTVERARELAQERTGEQIQGIDIQARKRKAREELTLGELSALWLEHAKERKRTWKEDERQINKFLAGLSSRRLSAIDVSDLEKLATRVKADSGPYQANRVTALLSSMFRHAMKRKLHSANPAGMVDKFPEQSRERFLTADEAPLLFAAIKKAEPIFRDFFTLAILTGARRGNLQAMRWADIDLTAATWAIPGEQHKNGQPVVLPLVVPALAILKARAAERNGSPYVFASHGKTGHLTEPKAAWDVVRKAAGLDGLRLHDLRRTMGSWMAGAGVALPIIGKALGHAAGSAATHTYARLQLAPVREAVTAATDAILAASTPKETKSKTKSKGGRSRGKKTK
ncbi:MAG: tyrosine-type recombinase/integrase [Planctomycetia bacterium]|nr:tyrosine-type recombinase/integrase [Planctomycetia bacterium]